MARINKPAAIRVVRIFVDASMNIIPQNDEPRSAIRKFKGKKKIRQHQKIW